ncbi:HNH endonuclease [Methylocystis heyeri]|uniref:Restriction endonuclease n=1 Tax=Methylocystis heyeri TaxID=391905 RepID=A0A6B8KCE9_9HYPH|nr:HNH endonuclease [Methylocystis heyeri]QGM45359.1 restriction endonuclease [Methylocystis heyeri]
MTKAVLTTKVTPVYDDLPEIRYHFPKSYLRQVSEAVGDWIVYYEPRRSTGDPSSSGGRQVYFATARVEHIIPDESRPDHFYAEVSNYLPFVRPVPFKEGSLFYEGNLKKPDGSTNKGAFGRAVRNIKDSEFDLIWQAGFGHVIGIEERTRPAPDAPEDPMPPLDGFHETPLTFLSDVPFEQDRRIVEQLISRPFRDRAFSAAVKSAYNDTCAMSGIKLINGGGRSEAQAAHIRPVEHRGPDSIRNGLALSGTFHWIFDRGLVSIDEDYTLLLAKDRLPDTIGRLLIGDRRLIVPERAELRPHPKFLDYHRREIFKG